MKMPAFFMSCDWGTSNIRLSLVETKSANVIEQISSDGGIKKLHRNLTSCTEDERFAYLSKYLAYEIEKIPQAKQNYPLLLSGMASSNMGLKEMAYAKMPIKMDGANLNYDSFLLEGQRNVILISGIRGTKDLARGEETQAIGLSNHLSNDTEGILLLPGTHSKHMVFNDEVFMDVSTHMTGELFDLVANHSILSGCIEAGPWSYEKTHFFTRGIDLALKDGAMANLFQLRANYLLGRSTAEENFYLLNGLLLGEELKSLQNVEDKIYLAATGRLKLMYESALKYLFSKEKIDIIDEEKVNLATILGHKKVLNHYLTKTNWNIQSS